MSFYVVPITGAGTSADPRRPSFIQAAGITSWAAVDISNSAIVWADATPAQDTLVAANVGAVVVPPLDNQIGAIALAAVQAQVENLNIPGDWITAAMTYRTVCRVIVGMAQLIQNMQGQGINVVLSQTVLNDTISQLPANVQVAIPNTVTALGLDASNITSSTTVRAALFNFGNQWNNGKDITIGNL